MLRPSLLLLLAAVATGALADPPPEPKVERNVAEDDQVRIEELKVRGETKKVTVKNKLTKAPEYEIVVNDAGRESAGGTGTGLPKSGSGTRVWKVLKF
ncbi:hypothetical protein NYO99_16850 [Pelomonas sp. UHG3]|jgi:hypothetical protein|uniref:Uncharacterized protein n=1 Tax=Roseateles hydrophilus TaxID=2975054 RepID=A0ACC6CDY0_9BURK|nr:hypothetical protein [Pelomonas sp. UHG3]MCY4746648.1 hypothetical protein [Pelomonas sp. UHG3]